MKKHTIARRSFRVKEVTARYTGRDLSGQRVQRIGIDAVQRWLAGGFTQMRCECGAVRLTPLAGPDGWPCVHSGGPESSPQAEQILFDDEGVFDAD